MTEQIIYNDHHIQIGLYDQAAEAIRTGGLEIIGDASAEQIAVIDQIRARDERLNCFYIYQQKSGIPFIKLRRFMFKDFHPTAEWYAAEGDDEVQDRVRRALEKPTGIWLKALNEINLAKRDFIAYSNVYEPGEEWFPIEFEDEISDIEFSPYFLEIN